MGSVVKHGALCAVDADKWIGALDNKSLLADAAGTSTTSGAHPRLFVPTSLRTTGLAWGVHLVLSGTPVAESRAFFRANAHEWFVLQDDVTRLTDASLAGAELGTFRWERVRARHRTWRDAESEVLVVTGTPRQAFLDADARTAVGMQPNVTWPAGALLVARVGAVHIYGLIADERALRFAQVVVHVQVVLINAVVALVIAYAVAP